MNRLTLALAHICREHLLEEKWLLAPSLRVGHQWAQAVTRGGQPVVNLHVKTLKSMVLELAAPELAKRGASLTSPRNGALLIDHLLGHLGSNALEYLSQLPASVGLSQAIYHSLDHLRLAGLDSGQLQPRQFEVAAKGRDVQQLLKEYRKALEAGSLCDYADILRMALLRLQQDASVLPADLRILVPDDADYHALERQLLRALPPAQRLYLPVDEPAGIDSQEIEVRTDLDLLCWLPVPSQAPAPLGDGSVQMFRAVGEVNEVREVLRRCLAARIPLDEVELLHTDAATYVPVIYETLAALEPVRTGPDGELPVTFVEGLPGRYSRPGRALLAWVAWVRDDYSQHTLVGMVREGLLAIPSQEEDPSFTRLASLLRAVGIGKGRERYLPKLDRQKAGLERQIETSSAVTDSDGESLLHRLESCRLRLRNFGVLRDLVDSLLKITPDPDAGWTAVLEAAIRFLDSLARRVSKLDNYAHERLVQDIQEMKRCLEQSAGPLTFDVWEWLAALPGEAQILGSGPREGCLHVAPVSSGGHAGRRQTFIVGLDDARFPGAGLQDPLVLDRERAQLCADLTTSASRLEATLRAFGRLLARLRGKVTLSYSCRDLPDDRDTFPSPVLLTAYRILSGKHEGDQSDLLAWPPLQTPVSFAPDQSEQCLDETEWWLWRLCGPQPVRNAMDLVTQRFPHLGRGLEAAQQRAGADFTIYDGRVEQAGVDLDPTAADGRVMSSRKLETAGRCPLAFFFQQGLGIEPPEELALDPTRWLHPLASGKLLHEVFEQFMRDLVEQDRLPVYLRDYARLDEIFASRAEIYKDLYPPPSDSVFQEQYRQLQRTVAVFLKEEENLCLSRNCRPVFLEAAIGMATAGPGTPLDTAEPVVISLPEGKRLRVRGRVDRVDRIGTGAVQTFAIWDYKSGSAFKYLQADPFRQGRVIQPFLYVSLVAHRLREVVSPEASVGLFGFFFPGVRERGLRMHWVPESLAAGSEILQRLSQIIRSGAFLATDNWKDDCGYCDYQSICGNVEAVAAASRRKLDNPSNTLLQPFLELRKVQDALSD